MDYKKVTITIPSNLREHLKVELEGHWTGKDVRNAQMHLVRQYKRYRRDMVLSSKTNEELTEGEEPEKEEVCQKKN